MAKKEHAIKVASSIGPVAVIPVTPWFMVQLCNSMDFIVHHSHEDSPVSEFINDIYDAVLKSEENETEE